VASIEKLRKSESSLLDKTGKRPFTLLHALSDPDRVHFNLNTSYYVKLWRKLTWNITFYGNWDNHPPPGFSGFFVVCALMSDLYCPATIRSNRLRKIPTSHAPQFATRST
jgi:hypothetical protein